MACLRQNKDGSLVIQVYVQPKASKNAVQGLHAGALKLSTTVPPVDGKANVAVIILLAEFFNLPRAAVTLNSGVRNRNKSFRMQGISLEQAVDLLARKGIC